MVHAVIGTPEFVRERPEQFLGSAAPDAIDIAFRIASTAFILTRAPVQVFQEPGWLCISAARDWLCVAGAPDYSPFLKLRPFPEGGVNAFRSEILATAFCPSVIAASSTEKAVLKGRPPELKLDTAALLERFSAQRLVLLQPPGTHDRSS